MKKILIIDDEIDFTDVLSKRLFKSGFNIITANSGIEGINKAKQEKPDIILLDINMPDKDGLHVFKDIRKNEETQEIPIIIISGIADEEEITTMSLAMGINPEDIIIKPFETKSLIDKINKTLNI